MRHVEPRAAFTLELENGEGSTTGQDNRKQGQATVADQQAPTQRGRSARALWSVGSEASDHVGQYSRSVLRICIVNVFFDGVRAHLAFHINLGR